MNCRVDTSWHRVRRRVGSVLAMTSVTMLPPLARAQTSPSTSKPIAEELFSQGREAMREGRYAEGCKKLTESQRLDPAAGTLLNLAVCHELEGKPATAWAEYSELVALARKEGQPERERIAVERMNELSSKLSYVTLAMPSAPTVPGLSVMLDGVPLGLTVLDSAIPIDPGSHVVEARAPGRQTLRRTFEIPARVGRYVVSLAAPALAPPPLPPQAPSSERKHDTTVKTVRALGIGGLALGAVAAGFGTYFALSANADWEERDEHCAHGCDEQAVRAWQSATKNAARADASFAFALVSGAAGVFLFVVPLDGGAAEVRVSGLPGAVSW